MPFVFNTDEAEVVVGCPVRKMKKEPVGSSDPINFSIPSLRAKLKKWLRYNSLSHTFYFIVNLKTLKFGIEYKNNRV